MAENLKKTQVDAKKEQTVAKHLGAKISEQKARLIAQMIRGEKIEKAITTLKFCDKKGADILLKVLESAIANAENNKGMDIDSLKIEHILVDRGPFLKRFHARGRGRGNRITKRSSNIAVILTDGK